jgi:hypothetical protein
MSLKKKIFYINESFDLLDDFIAIFLKSYNPLNKIKEFFKKEELLELIIINKEIQNKLLGQTKTILDIFLI